MNFYIRATLRLFLLASAMQNICMDTNTNRYQTDEPLAFWSSDDATSSAIEYAPPLDQNMVDIACADVPLEVKDLMDQLHEYPILPLLTKLYLFVGEPGAGKTTLARAIAQKENWPCVMVPVTELPNEYQDSASAGLVRCINPILEDGNKCVIVLDEITHLTDNYNKGHNNHDRTATTLWRLFDKCTERNNIVVIGTANNIKTLPAPLKSRFDEGTITISMPSLTTRTLLMKNLFKSNLSITDSYLEKIACQAYNKSFRDMVSVFNKASRIARRQRRAVTEDDITEAIRSWRSWYHPLELCRSAAKKGESALSFCEPALPYIHSTIKFGLTMTPIALQIAALYMNGQQATFQRDTASKQSDMQREGLDLQRSSYALQVDSAAMQKKGLALQELGYHVQRLASYDRLVSSHRVFIHNHSQAKKYNIHDGYGEGWWWL